MPVNPAYDWLVEDRCPLIYKFLLYFATLDYTSLVKVDRTSNQDADPVRKSDKCE